MSHLTSTSLSISVSAKGPVVVVSTGSFAGAVPPMLGGLSTVRII